MKKFANAALAVFLALLLTGCLSDLLSDRGYFIRQGNTTEVARLDAEIVKIMIEDLETDRKDRGEAIQKGDSGRVRDIEKSIARNEKRLAEEMHNARERAVQRGDTKAVGKLDNEIAKQKLRLGADQAQAENTKVAEINARKRFDERQKAEQAEKARQQAEHMSTIAQDAAAPVLIQREITAHQVQ